MSVHRLEDVDAVCSGCFHSLANFAQLEFLGMIEKSLARFRQVSPYLAHFFRATCHLVMKHIDPLVLYFYC